MDSESPKKIEKKKPEESATSRPVLKLPLDFNRRVFADTVRSLKLDALDTEEEDIPLFI